MGNNLWTLYINSHSLFSSSFLRKRENMEKQSQPVPVQPVPAVQHDWEKKTTEISERAWQQLLIAGAIVIIAVVMIGGIEFEIGEVKFNCKGYRAGQKVRRRR